MSDNELDDVTTDADADDNAATAEKQNWRRKLEADAEAGRKATEEAATAKKELAFLRAGVDLNSPQGKLLSDAYRGDLTADAVKAAAVEYGILTADQPAVPAEEFAAHDRISSAASGGSTPNDGDAAMAELLAADNEQAVLEALTRAGVPVESQRPGEWLRPAGMGYVPVS